MGVVAKVVTSAISTSMVKTCWEMTPRSYPMLSTMSSIRPRVFIKMPTALASRHLRPVRRAATELPPNFPRVATPMMAAVTSHSEGWLTSPIWVRSPEKAKNSGSSIPTATVSMRSAMVSAR